MNRLLAALPGDELGRWLPQLERVRMSLGQVLFEPGGPPSHAYFPTTSLVALLYVMENGATSEIAAIGHEGMVGVALFMGGGATSSRAVVQCAGEGFRLPGHELPMTQELIANMLGVRREGVTEAALKLQQAGLIRYARGRISVLDRSGLEQRVCECYAVVNREYDRLLPPAASPMAATAGHAVPACC